MNAGAKDATDWTVARLLAWTQEYFGSRGLESPRLCAELLLAHAMQCERIHLFTRYDEVLAEPVRSAFRELVRGAASGKPIAYLTGAKEFFSLKFTVTPAVLIPRPETEILVERAISLQRQAKAAAPRILDIGTGSGCIAVSLAKHLGEAQVGASDVSAAALAVAQDNAAQHGVAERIDFRAGDLFEPWQDEPPCDLIVSNPPYVASSVDAPVDDSVRDYEPHEALFAGPEGLDVLQRLVPAALAHLKPGGHLLVEVGFDQAAAMRTLLEDAGWIDIRSYRDGAGHERIWHARRRAENNAQVA